MILIIMIPFLILIGYDGWQYEDNIFLLITAFLAYLNYKDAMDKDSEEYYGGY